MIAHGWIMNLLLASKVQACTIAGVFKCLEFSSLASRNQSYVLTPFSPLVFFPPPDYYVSFSLEARGWKHGVLYQGRMVKGDDFITVSGLFLGFFAHMQKCSIFLCTSSLMILALSFVYIGSKTQNLSVWGPVSVTKWKYLVCFIRLWIQCIHSKFCLTLIKSGFGGFLLEKGMLQTGYQTHVSRSGDLREHLSIGILRSLLLTSKLYR